jgi:hypothetical protein
MSTLALEKQNLKDFIKQNKEKIYKAAEENTVRNTKGQATISKDDPWFYENEWDKHFKRMDPK